MRQGAEGETKFDDLGPLELLIRHLIQDAPRDAQWMALFYRTIVELGCSGEATGCDKVYNSSHDNKHNS